MTSKRWEGPGQRSSRATVDRAGTQERPAPTAVRPWLLAVALALFAVVPVLARLLVALAGGPSVASADPPSVAASVALGVHAATGTLFTMLGAFQFPTSLRRRSTWHPRVGRLLVPLGLTAALSALWLTLFYSHTDGTEQLLYVFRLLFGVAMVTAIVVGFTAIKRRNIIRHRAWMIRSYALGLAASTQIFTLGFGAAVFGTGEVSTALLTAAGWVINLGVAEWVIRHRRREPRQPERVRPPQQRTQDAVGQASPSPGAGASAASDPDERDPHRDRNGC